jgi:thiosulfate/3-mercaptopyruvate sulfurtransferase
MTNVIVSTDDVAAMLGKRGVRVIEVSMDREAYASGHIDGALDIDWQRQLIEEEDESSGKVIDPERFGALARRLGLDINDSLVFYGDQGGRHAARALWTFEYYRHRGPLHWMDGGREKWLSEGRPMTAETQPLVPSAYPVPSQRQPNMRITLDEIRSQLGKPSMSVLDVRTEEEYQGAVVRAARGGHIPGALHVFWEDALEPDKSLRPKAELEALYRDVPRDATVAVHCQLGVRAAHTWLVLRHLLDYPDVRNYDGSWQEWGNRDDTPIDGETKRDP